jgi:hypothetical protein
MSAPSLPPVGPDLRVWAQQLTRALLRGLVRLNFLSPSDIPSENGIILWDDVNGYPVVPRMANLGKSFLRTATIMAALPAT